MSRRNRHSISEPRWTRPSSDNPFAWLFSDRSGDEVVTLVDITFKCLRPLVFHKRRRANGKARSLAKKRRSV